MNPKYLAIDPGLTSGWATFTDEGAVIEWGQFKMAELTQWLNDYLTSDLTAVIVEDYKNHGWTQQKKWSRNDTSKIIGKIELMGELRNVPVHLQPNTAKRIGYMWAGLGEAPTNHTISHQFDAVAHGVYWLVKAGIRQLGTKDDTISNQ